MQSAKRGGRGGGGGQVELTSTSCQYLILNDASVFNQGQSAPMS